MASDVDFDQKDKIRRKIWLYYAILYCIGFPCFLLILESFTSFHFQRYDLKVNPIIISIVDVIVGFISFWIPYHCAYKNCGTKWLTFLVTYWTIVNIFSLKFLNFARFDVFEFAFWTLGFLIPVGWYVVTWNLRRTNRKIQLQKNFPQVANSCVEMLGQSHSLEELNMNLYQLMQVHTDFEPLLWDAYQAKKRSLST
jgi:hypothetical protein